MLVLSRKINAAVRIGKEIEVKVLSIQGNTVRLGIQAPAYIPIHREEVTHHKIKSSSDSIIKLHTSNHKPILH